MGPGVDGLELLQTLRRMDVDVPFFIVSSHGESKLKEEAFKRGAKGLISKDEQLNDFQGVARTIDQIIEEYLCLL